MEKVFGVMKKYFAEYLPVEGEIKKGDKYIIGKGLGLGAYETGYIGTAAIDFTKDAQRDQEAKKLALHLCSRDIQVGDRVFLENGYNYFANVIDKVGGSDRDIILDKMPEQRGNGTLDYREMVKVIGLISPEAIWVTRGMEFDEKELCYLIGGSSVKKPMSGFNSEPKEWLTEVDIFVLCPNCKTFH